jgi:crossover junction endodeoxyribonuclease RusA
MSKFTLVHAPCPRIEEISLNIPIPPSTNNLFINRGKYRAIAPEYEQWRQQAGWILKSQRPKHISGEIDIEIKCQRKSARSDISNRIKAVEDLLVHCNVIDDDRFVQSVKASWADIEGCQVIIRRAK